MNYDPNDYPALRPLTVHVCDACLKSEGAECHTPGCLFWLHDVPRPGQIEMLKAGMLP